MPRDPSRCAKLVPRDNERLGITIDRNLDQPALALHDHILSLENVADPIARRLPAESFGVSEDATGFRHLAVAIFRDPLAEHFSDTIRSHAADSFRYMPPAHQPGGHYGAFSDRMSDFNDVSRALQAMAFGEFEKIVVSLAMPIPAARQNLLWANDWTIKHILLNFIEWIPQASEGLSNSCRDWLAPLWLSPLVLNVPGRTSKNLLLDKKHQALTAEGTRLLFGRMVYGLNTDLVGSSALLVEQHLLKSLHYSTLPVGCAVERKRSPVAINGTARGRPRKDGERKEVQELRKQGKSWRQIAIHLNGKTGQNKTAEAYRQLGKPSSNTSSKG
jgi:hypothetical protein